MDPPSLLSLPTLASNRADQQAKLTAIYDSLAKLKDNMKHMQDAEAAAQTEIDTASGLLASTLGPQVRNQEY